MSLNGRVIVNLAMVGQNPELFVLFPLSSQLGSHYSCSLLNVRLVIRTDGSSSIGAGHVMRCLAIAEESVSRGIPTFLVGQVIDMPWLTQRILKIPSLNWILKQTAFTPNAKTDYLLLDSYELSISDPFIAPSRWRRIVTLVDEVTPKYAADIMIHPGIDASWAKDQNIYFGRNFVPIRKGITKHTNQESSNLRIIVVGGGANPRNVVGFVARELQKYDLDFSVLLFIHRLTAMKDLDSRFTVRANGEELDVEARNADLVITTASTTSLEFLARETAIGIVSVTKNQESYYESLSKQGLVCPLGKVVENYSKFNHSSLHKLLYSYEYRMRLRSNTKGFIDLRGASRIVDLIFENLNKFPILNC